MVSGGFKKSMAWYSKMYSNGADSAGNFCFTAKDSLAGKPEDLLKSVMYNLRGKLKS
jgi:hypothetical protein